MAIGSTAWSAISVPLAVRTAIANNTRQFRQIIRRSGVHHGSTVRHSMTNLPVITWQYGSSIWSAIPFGHAWETIFITQSENAGSHLWLPCDSPPLLLTCRAAPSHRPPPPQVPSAVDVAAIYLDVRPHPSNDRV